MSEESIHNEFMARLSGEREEVANPEFIEEPTAALDGDPEVDEVIEEDGEFDTTEDTDSELDTEEEADSEEDGDPSDVEESEEVSAEYKELEERYKSLEAEFSRVTANRKAIEASLDEAKTKATEALYAIEDKFGEAEQVADYFAGMANQQLQQLQQINPATLTQEQFGQYQQAFQAAQMQVQQHNALIENIRAEREATREKQKEREAEIAKERLKVRIPDWSSEKYKALGELAGEYGYSQKEFFDSTDHRLIVLLNEVAASKDAAKVVEKKVRKGKKPTPPKHATARAQERNELGQFKRAQEAFLNSPGQKGSFAAMKAAELAAQRKGK